MTAALVTLCEEHREPYAAIMLPIRGEHMKEWIRLVGDNDHLDVFQARDIVFCEPCCVHETCHVRMSDGAECGYSLTDRGAVCELGHKQ